MANYTLLTKYGDSNTLNTVRETLSNNICSTLVHGFQFGWMELPNFQDLATFSKTSFNH